jgi:hypothetical protein
MFRGEILISVPKYLIWCQTLHGVAYSGNTLAFGCVGKTVLYDIEKKETKEIPLKDAGSRVGTFKFVAESDLDKFILRYLIINVYIWYMGIMRM